jgi:hypothetical protein
LVNFVSDSATNLYFGTADAALKFVTESADAASSTMKATLNAIITDAETRFPGVLKLYQDISGYIEDLSIKFQEYFKGTIWAKLYEYYLCIDQANTFTEAVKKTVKAVKKKADQIVTAVGSGVLLPIADILVALLCNWTGFKKAILLFIQASTQPSIVKSYEFWGKGMGALIYTIGSAKTIQDALGSKK